MLRAVAEQIGDDSTVDHGHTGFFPRDGYRNLTSHIDSFDLHAT